MIEDDEYRCTACGKECDVVAEVSIDREPYGDQFVERRSYELYSNCCQADVEAVEETRIIH
tara:strand:- start:399 stop:581 length:183 start_codon:yes stop_codon:yes gene_type:complete